MRDCDSSLHKFIEPQQWTRHFQMWIKEMCDENNYSNKEELCLSQKKS